MKDSFCVNKQRDIIIYSSGWVNWKLSANDT